MTKAVVHTDAAPAGLAGYSQAIKAGGMVYVSGMAGVDASTGKLVGPTIQEQTAQSLRNVQTVLEAAGSSLDKVVWALWSLRHAEDFDGFNEEWARWFTHEPPARHGTQMALPDRLSGVLISIGVVAEA